MLSVRPGTVLFPGVYYSPGIRFKTTAVILAVVLRLLSYNTCRGKQLLRPNSCSWLLHLPGTAPTDRGSSFSPVLSTESYFSHLPGNFRIFYCNWEGLLVTKSEKSLLFCMKKWNIITFSYWKVKNHYFFVLKSVKSLLIHKIK